jgi:hypothetical protein
MLAFQSLEVLQSMNATKRVTQRYVPILCDPLLNANIQQSNLFDPLVSTQLRIPVIHWYSNLWRICYAWLINVIHILMQMFMLIDSSYEIWDESLVQSDMCFGWSRCEWIAGQVSQITLYKYAWFKYTLYTKNFMTWCLSV